MVRLILAAFMLALLGLSGCAAPQLRPTDNRLLAGRTYVVTGASSGFGRGVAERLDPRRVAEAIVWVSLHPREELPVGWKAQGAVAAHRLLPDLTERVAADIQHRELGKGSPARATPGNVHRPMEECRGVMGGVRQRMKREDQARRRRGGR